MKSILLPTDFSPNSMNAIRYATDMFKDVVCKFYVLNVQKASSFISDDFRTMSPSTTIYQSIIETTKTSLNELVAKIETKNNPNHSFETAVDYDNFIDAINQMCEAKHIELIVMGTKGATGAERVVFGSNTVRIMQRCSVPVLAIPQNCKYNGMDKIAFTSNFLTLYNMEELLPLVQIAELYQSRIEILHMVEEEHLSQDQENNRAFLDTCFRYVSHEFIDLAGGNLFDGVMAFIKKKDVKMLAIMSRKHSFLERLFTKHNVERFGFKIKVPLLVLENSGKLYPKPV